VLEVDSKNYHTWVYRQWVLAHFGGLPTTSETRSKELGAGQYPDLWKGELEFIERLLSEDARNNSAWNHRYFCIFASGWSKSKSKPDQCQEWWNLGKNFDAIVKGEIAYVKGHIATIPNNASAWNYLRG
jgi:protein farnesyltransferase/geranylgeranyltransferase type-1 subunit alpha